MVRGAATAAAAVLAGTTRVASHGVRLPSSDISNDGTVSCWANDDSVYTSTSCEVEDGSACEMYCDDDCQEWCGTACDEGYGALCAFTILSTLDSFCHENVSTADAAALVEAARAAPEMRPLVFVDAAAPSTDANDDADDHSHDSGCDDHAFCEYCDVSDMCTYALLEASKDALSTETYAHLVYEGAGPMAMVLLGRLPKLCAAMSTATTALDADPLLDTAAIGNALAAAATVAGLVVIGAAVGRRSRAPAPRETAARTVPVPGGAPADEDRLLSPAS